MGVTGIDGRYNIIYTDPPWPQKKGNARKVRANQGKDLDYATMNMADIEELHRIFLSENTSEKHNVFVWTIDKFLPETEQMFEGLGYSLHARMIWDKENGIAPAFTVRFSHEYLLWFYQKGNMLMPDREMRGKYTTVIREPSTFHSKKPNAAYEMIEAMFPDSSRLELFARNRRSGWDSWGNEVPQDTITNIH